MTWLRSLFFLLLFLLWLLLTRADLASLLVGLPFILLALWSYCLQSRRQQLIRVSALGLLHFVSYFLVESLRGGLDIALRVWHPRLPLAPQFYEYPLIFPAGYLRTFFMYCINLLPGTLSVHVSEQNTLYLHVLDGRGPLDQDLSKLEQRICELFRFTPTQERKL